MAMMMMAGTAPKPRISKLRGKGNKAASVAMWCPTWYAAISISYLLVLLLRQIDADAEPHHETRSA
jgi:hypothetical protein